MISTEKSYVNQGIVIDKYSGRRSDDDVANLLKSSKYGGRVLKPKKLIIFDFDEALAQTTNVWPHVFKRAMERLGEEKGINIPFNKKFKEEFAKHFFYVFHNVDFGIFKTMQEQKDMFEYELKPFIVETWKEKQILDMVKLYNGWKEVIKTLAEVDVKMAVASSRDLATIVSIFEREDILQYFEKDLILASQGGIHWKDKPNPEMLLHAMQEVGATEANSVMVGDNVVDVKAGKTAGIHTMAIGYGQETPVYKLENEQPSRIIYKEEVIKVFPIIVDSLFGKQPNLSTNQNGEYKSNFMGYDGSTR